MACRLEGMAPHNQGAPHKQGTPLVDTQPVRIAVQKIALATSVRSDDVDHDQVGWNVLGRMVHHSQEAAVRTATASIKIEGSIPKGDSRPGQM